MTTRSYITVRHPRSGEDYAVEMDTLDEAGESVLIRAAGPLHHTHQRDADSLRDYLDNQSEHDTRDDAIWLRREIERA